MIGFIQGRLSPQIDGKIQCFPWPTWEEEFPKARNLDVHLLEWTLDIHRIYENPFMTTDGQAKIKRLMAEYNISIPSLTGDFLMQFPFYKLPERFEEGKRTYIDVIKACGALGVRFLVFPLVDHGKLENDEQELKLIDLCFETLNVLEKSKVVVTFESDYPPLRLRNFINKLPSEHFGVNYDVGNSAALGFDPEEEILAYPDRIYNIHIKDRVLGGTTVPLGAGNADFNKVFKNLKKINYQGNYILQTARASDGDHEGAIKRYKDFVLNQIRNH